ncbi:hypothetical protein [Streptomyces beihaiensis]|uniref:Uncharacterized protein n=1 Tax=Streptomyces beihaiensis TaxID=2984495 RepID=A0ABT3TZP8_9ACTN|nr:hypothetical protein [Streptomyces beihaiensis]MCX3061525.1 hypothetical protein [Streptomyces beihaiensis]
MPLPRLGERAGGVVVRADGGRRVSQVGQAGGGGVGLAGGERREPEAARR